MTAVWPVFAFDGVRILLAGGGAARQARKVAADWKLQRQSTNDNTLHINIDSSA